MVNLEIMFTTAAYKTYLNIASLSQIPFAISMQCNTIIKVRFQQRFCGHKCTGTLTRTHDSSGLHSLVLSKSSFAAFSESPCILPPARSSWPLSGRQLPACMTSGQPWSCTSIKVGVSFDHLPHYTTDEDIFCRSGSKKPNSARKPNVAFTSKYLIVKT